MRQFLLIVCVLIFSKAFTQGNGRISGSVQDSLTGSPLEYASISLIEKASSKTVDGSITDKSGRFLISGVKNGFYEILIEVIGYQSYRIEKVEMLNESKIELPAIRMRLSQNQLQTVTVVASAKLVTNKIDRVVYNAEKDITSQTGVAIDVLRKVPQVSVDINGNVEIAGNSSIRFLINGKPSTAFGNSVADVLQSIPASQIKNIEVITNPGAKYDAQGVGGIINIILKQNNAQGINGNVSLAAGTRAENGSLNFNARKGNLGANAFASGNFRPAFNTPVTTVRNSFDTANSTQGQLVQNGLSHFNRGGYQAGLNLDWSPGKKDVFNGSISFNRFGNRGHSTIDQQQTLKNTVTNTIISDANSKTFSNSRYTPHAIDAGFSWKHDFKKEDQTLEFAATSSFGRSLTNSDNYQLRLPQETKTYGNLNRNPGKENETEITLDYTQPFAKDVMLGTGLKYGGNRISSRSTVNSYQPSSGDYLFDQFLSNDLNYHLDVYAAYAELSFPVAKILDAKLGGRYEKTDINSYFSNAGQQAKTPGYQNFVPSIFLSRQLNEKQLKSRVAYYCYTLWDLCY